jgi:agmatine deiminase
LLRGARQENLRFFACPSNDTWARDHGGITIFEDGKPVLLDFVFNGWGLKFPAQFDNLITGRLHAAGLLRAEKRHGGMVLEGGGIESDGQGTLMTTTACMFSPNRNPQLGMAELETQLKSLFGLQRILWLENGYLAGDDTDSHIDTLARFCSPDTIAYVQCVDSEEKHYAALQAMEAELQAFRQGNGEPYRLIPLPMVSPCYSADGHRLPATYANFLIINGAVIAPVYGEEEDEAALKQLALAFPQHEILPLNCRLLIEQHGSLHCITMQYPAGVVA